VFSLLEVPSDIKSIFEVSTWGEKKKGNIGLDRPLGLQEVEAPRISRHSAHEGGKVVSHMHWSPLPPGDFPGTHFWYKLS